MLAAQQATPAVAAAAAEKAAQQAAHEDRKRREIFCGNMAAPHVTPDMVRELFNAMLAGFVPNPLTEPPVAGVRMDPLGRFAFVEMRTLELTDVAVRLDKTELLGRPLNVSRPKGWEPPAAAVPGGADKLSLAQQFAAQLSGGSTSTVLLEGLAPVRVMRDAEERAWVVEDVALEANKCGIVIGLAAPVPPDAVPADTPARVYVRFADAEAAGRCKAAMDGRSFDGQPVAASFTTEIDWQRSLAGEWLPKQALL